MTPIPAEAPGRVRPGGWIILEIGEGQAEKAADLAAPAFEHEVTRKDLRGIPRIVVLRKTAD